MWSQVVVVNQSRVKETVRRTQILWRTHDLCPRFERTMKSLNKVRDILDIERPTDSVLCVFAVIDIQV
jgi:hypothetical protein